MTFWHDIEQRLARRGAAIVRGDEAAIVRGDEAAIAIRPARDEDARALRELAIVDSAEPLDGPALVALVDGGIVAALALADGRVVADPFRRTSAAVQLLRLRVLQLRTADGGPGRRRSPRRLARRARA